MLEVFLGEDLPNASAMAQEGRALTGWNRVLGGGSASAVSRGIGMPLILSLIVVGLLACGAATARMNQVVRVLIYEGSDPIQLGPVGETREIGVDGEGRLLVAGGHVESTPWQPSGSGPWRVGDRTVRGQISVQLRAGRIQVLNQVDLEAYVASTVGGEMSPSWPTEALRAQAVAARTYVLHEASRRTSAGWDVRATAMSQVYRGVGAETSETRSAARSTEGEVLIYAGKPILAVFHSTAGGKTASAGEVWGEDLPYLRVVDVEDEEDAPKTYWRMERTMITVEGAMAGTGAAIGKLEDLSVQRRTASGRVEEILAEGAGGVVRFAGSALRALVGEFSLPSTLFDIRKVEDGFAFVGSGHGHGVGMSQWGARAMAQQGASYRRILARFYPGTRLENRASRRIAGRGPRRVLEGDEK